VKTKREKDNLIIDRLIKRIERVGITEFTYRMVTDYIAKNMNEIRRFLILILHLMS